VRSVHASLALGELCEDNAKAEQCKLGGDRDVAALFWKGGDVSSSALQSGCSPILFARYHHQRSLLHLSHHPPLPSDPTFLGRKTLNKKYES